MAGMVNPMVLIGIGVVVVGVVVALWAIFGGGGKD